MDDADLEGTEMSGQTFSFLRDYELSDKKPLFSPCWGGKEFILTHTFELSNVELSQSEAYPSHLMGQRPGKTDCLTWRGQGSPLCSASPCDSSLNRKPQHPHEERRMTPKMSTCQSLEPVNTLPFMSEGFSRCN